jgi:hypothetical protein
VPKHSRIQISPAVWRLTLSMRVFWVALPIFAGLLMANAAHAQQPAGKWYYCDPTHAYYPYVKTCAVPWREVAPYFYRQGQPQAIAPPAMQPAAPA